MFDDLACKNNFVLNMVGVVRIRCSVSVQGACIMVVCTAWCLHQVRVHGMMCIEFGA